MKKYNISLCSAGFPLGSVKTAGDLRIAWRAFVATLKHSLLSAPTPATAKDAKYKAQVFQVFKIENELIFCGFLSSIGFIFQGFSAAAQRPAATGYSIRVGRLSSRTRSPLCVPFPGNRKLPSLSRAFINRD